MGLRSFFSKIGGGFRTTEVSKSRSYRPKVGEDGLISQEAESVESAEDKNTESNPEGKEHLLRKIKPVSKAEPLEKLQQGFEKLVEQLEGINEHLNRHIGQNEELMKRIEHLPDLLENFPILAENQKKMIEELTEQVKGNATRNQQFMETVAKIPAETAKQTDALVGINHQLAAAADTDVEMAENFNKFNEALDKLNQSTVGQTDSILQMSKTFATSDRYLKYIISREKKRFMWLLLISIGVCVAVILILAGIIIYVKR